APAALPTGSPCRAAARSKPGAMLLATESPPIITRPGPVLPAGVAGAVGAGPRSAAATPDSRATAPPVVNTSAVASKPAVAGAVTRARHRRCLPRPIRRPTTLKDQGA